MNLREAGGCVGRATEVQCYVLVGTTAGRWLTISKPDARLLIESAQEEGEIDCEMVGTVCRLGVEHDMENDSAAEPGPVCSECGAEWDGDEHECASD